MILQDCALLLKNHKQEHYIFKNNPGIFDTGLFKYYTTKLSLHVNKENDENDLNIDHVLPGLLMKMDVHVNATKYLYKDMKLHHEQKSVKVIK